jgi:hypothetical protein
VYVVPTSGVNWTPRPLFPLTDWTIVMTNVTVPAALVAVTVDGR